MKNKYQETHKTWNKVAQLYQDHFMGLLLYNDSYDLFCSLINSRISSVLENIKAPSILELGCGPGNITKYISDKNPNFNILATDIGPSMIELAKKNVPSAKFQVLDARDLATLNRKFIAAICGFIIPYLDAKDCAALIANLSTTLEADGILYLSFVAGDYSESGFISGSTGDRAFFYYHPLDFIEKELSKNGFVIHKNLKADYKKSDGNEEEHTIVLARKGAQFPNYPEHRIVD